ncbi:MAG: hypothetical protein NTV57_17245 [Cyanobacteria bacterium]|nr:hypothetical protein [Cyanobacteriota bacterium]
MTSKTRFRLQFTLKIASRLGAKHSDQHHAGSILLTTLVVILVAIIGGATLMSKGINSLNASSDASDLQTAKEAAETGFNEILAALNTDERSYLLVTNFANWGSGGVTAADLNSCNIYHPATTLAGAPPGYPSSTSFYKTSGYNATVTYKLEGYTPPASASAPATCTKFGNLFGGSATFTILGTISRGGKQQASFRLKKVVFVRGPFTESSEPFDAPLLITGKGASSNNDVTKMDQKKFGLSWIPDACITANNRKCNSPSPGLQTTYVVCSGSPTCVPPTSNIGPLNANGLPLPTFPAAPSSFQDKRSDEQYESDKDSITYNTTLCNFPYFGATGCPTASTASSSTFIKNQLEKRCYYNISSQPDNSGGTRNSQITSASTSINCVVMTINNPNIKVNTAGLPVNVFVKGEGTAIDVRTGDFSNLIPLNWAKLRIFGKDGDGSDCSKQTILIGVLQLDGLFIWMPAGKIIYPSPGGGGGNNGPYGVRWVCAFDSKNSANLDIIGPSNAVAGLATIFPNKFNTIDPDNTFNPTGVPSNITNYRAYGVTY